MRLCVLFYALYFFPVSLAQVQDPLNNLCRIFGHQTALVDNNLYVNGGQLTWQDPKLGHTNYTNTWLKKVDLNNSTQGSLDQFKLNKDGNVPSLSGGLLFPDVVNKVIYLYGGEYKYNPPDFFAFWYYDIINDTWNVTANASIGGVIDLTRAYWGAGATVDSNGAGYYYGGWIGNTSEPGWTGQPQALTSVFSFTFQDNTFRNQSGPDDIPRAEGSMIFIPASDLGTLVIFGGLQFPYGNSTSVGVPMSEILVYDIANQLWYRQNATGDVPEDRRRFCTGVTWADDKTSYNIYVFGGAPIDEGTGFSDVYVLSVPSFRWIKYAEPEITPRHSCTCDVVGRSQMIVTGGFSPENDECDENGGQHVLDLNGGDKKWLEEFNATKTQYEVPSEVIAVIGGGPTGGATLSEPQSGWIDQDLAVYFTRVYTPLTRTPTRYIPTSSAPLPTTSPITSPTTPPASYQPAKTSNRKLTAGAVSGSVVGVILLFATCVIFIYKKNKKKRNERFTTEQPEGSPGGGPLELDSEAKVPPELDSIGRVELRAPVGAELDSSIVAELDATARPRSPMQS